MATKGQKATFRTIGGNTLVFVHEGDPYGYGSWTCNGCHTDARSKVEEANSHASQCRAQ